MGNYLLPIAIAHQIDGSPKWKSRGGLQNRCENWVGLNPITISSKKWIVNGEFCFASEFYNDSQAKRVDNSQSNSSEEKKFVERRSSYIKLKK